MLQRALTVVTYSYADGHMTHRISDVRRTRAAEWGALERFVASPTRLGALWGTRRSGVSALAGALARATGGLHLQPGRLDPALCLAEVGASLGARLGVGTIGFPSWTDALDGLLGTADCPVVVLDGFGHLTDASPDLAAALARALGSQRPPGAPRLLLCGSGAARRPGLFAPEQPLHGLADLVVELEPLDFRAAARCWGVGDPALARRVHTVVGGVAGYRDLIPGPTRSPGRFDRWIVTTVLAPGSPLLEEDALALRSCGLEATVHRSVIAAVGRGDRTPSEVAHRIARPVTSLSGPVERLVAAGLLRRIPDPLRTRRSRYEPADPFLAFHDAVVRPNLAALRAGRADEVWAQARRVWQSTLLGPHLASLCREAVERHAHEFGVAGAALVGATEVADRRRNVVHELDVVATDADGRVVALGAVHPGNRPRPAADLVSLEHARARIGERATEARLLLFAAAGFTPELREAARGRTDVELIGLARLYGRAQRLSEPPEPITA